MLPEIANYLELLNKLNYDLERYRENNHIYQLMDCLLTLNSLPEWIVKSSEASPHLKAVTTAKIKIMKGDGFIFDEDKLDTDIDHQLRLIRLVCNHSKHKTDSNLIPIMKSKFGGTLPINLPGKFCNIIAIGVKEIDAEHLIESVAGFWRTEINR